MAELALDPLVVVSFNALLLSTPKDSEPISRAEILDLMMAMADAACARSSETLLGATIWSPPSSPQLG